jgi:hypothetical protein
VSLWSRLPGKGTALALVLAAVPFALGKYIEFNTAGAFDSGAYMYSARRVLAGAVPGVDEAVTAKVGTLLANMLGIWLFGYVDHAAKMIQMLLQMAALATMFFVMRRIFGLLAAGVAVVVASLYLSAPAIAKYGNVKEQYMIAFMILGISMLLMRQAGGRWLWAVLAGAFLAWGPMFKETGCSAIGASLIFILAQPLLRHRTWKLAFADVGLAIFGGVLAIAPVQVWIMHIGAPAAFNPYVTISRFAAGKIRVLLPRQAAPPARVADESGATEAGKPRQAAGDYIGGARALVPLSKQAPMVLRWYAVLILPVSLALASVITRVVRAILVRLRKIPAESVRDYERLVLLLGLWWLFDMGLVWLSPRPWEEYYLPLCASGAATGAYLVALYSDRLRHAANRPAWAGAGVAGAVCMVAMAWQIIFGLRTAPFTGGRYPEPRHGYLQRLSETKGTADWENVAHYIRANSDPQETIYVWGWFPGIYVESQRDSASRQLPFTSESHVMLPRELARQVQGLLESFRQSKPKFIVDTRKYDFPHTCPPLEFWPWVDERGFLPADPAIVRIYESQWHQVLKEQVSDEEAERFEAMKPLRDYIMANYEIVMRNQYRQSSYGLLGPFGTHVLFVRKAGAE